MEVRRTFIILAAFLIAAASCNKEDKLRLERLQEELDALQNQPVASVPDLSVEPVPGEYRFTFDKELYGVDAGGSVTVNYTLPEESTVEVSVIGGWSATTTGGAEGSVTVSCPDPAQHGEVVVTATSVSGLRTAATLPIMVRDPYSDATRPKIDAMGYYSFKPWNATLENYQKLADAGITMVTVETDEEDYLHQMDLARAVGIKVLAVIGWATGSWYDAMSEESLKRLKDLIDSLKDRPELYGYHIYDEPSVNLIYQLMAIEDKMLELDPDHPIYVNLHPNASAGSLGVNNYYDYVEAFASMMHLKQLSFDIYPVLDNGLTQSDWHMCLSTVASAAKRYGMPLWTFAASCWIDKEAVLLHRAKPNVANILLQVYTNLAYGAQMVQYFTIQDYGGTSYAPIMRDGTWTQAYDDLKTANLTMQKRAFVFKGCNVIKIRQLGNAESHENALSILDFPPEIKSMWVSHSATVSFVENGGDRYMAVVNNYWPIDQVIAIELNEPAYLIGSDGQFKELDAGITHISLPMGDMVVIKYR